MNGLAVCTGRFNPTATYSAVSWIAEMACSEAGFRSLIETFNMALERAPGTALSTMGLDPFDFAVQLDRAAEIFLGRRLNVLRLDSRRCAVAFRLEARDR